VASYDQCGFRDVLAGAVCRDFSALGHYDRLDPHERDLVGHNLSNLVDLLAPGEVEHREPTNGILRLVGDTQHPVVKCWGPLLGAANDKRSNPNEAYHFDFDSCSINGCWQVARS
jgi:hypothetical protein